MAAITFVAYNGITARAADTQRISDMKSIVKALEVYKVNNDGYPSPVSTENASGWEVSTNGSSPTNFLSALVSPNGVTKIPVDPKNTGNANNLNPGSSPGDPNNFEYFYFRYQGGTRGCDGSRGNFYVLGIARMDSVKQGQTSPDSPGFNCPGGATWNNYGYAWVTGGYTN